MPTIPPPRYTPPATYTGAAGMTAGSVLANPALATTQHSAVVNSVIPGESEPPAAPLTVNAAVSRE